MKLGRLSSRKKSTASTLDSVPSSSTLLSEPSSPASCVSDPPATVLHVQLNDTDTQLILKRSSSGHFQMHLLGEGPSEVGGMHGLIEACRWVPCKFDALSYVTCTHGPRMHSSSFLYWLQDLVMTEQEQKDLKLLEEIGLGLEFSPGDPFIGQLILEVVEAYNLKHQGSS